LVCEDGDEGRRRGWRGWRGWRRDERKVEEGKRKRRRRRGTIRRGWNFFGALRSFVLALSTFVSVRYL
jgi:hypothetical protein